MYDIIHIPKTTYIEIAMLHFYNELSPPFLNINIKLLNICGTNSVFLYCVLDYIFLFDLLLCIHTFENLLV